MLGERRQRISTRFETPPAAFKDIFQLKTHTSPLFHKVCNWRLTMTKVGVETWQKRGVRLAFDPNCPGPWGVSGTGFLGLRV